MVYAHIHIQTHIYYIISYIIFIIWLSIFINKKCSISAIEQIYLKQDSVHTAFSNCVYTIQTIFIYIFILKLYIYIYIFVNSNILMRTYQIWYSYLIDPSEGFTKQMFFVGKWGSCWIEVDRNEQYSLESKCYSRT